MIDVLLLFFPMMPSGQQANTQFQLQLCDKQKCRQRVDLSHYISWWECT
jgi:hypothetical protein